MAPSERRAWTFADLWDTHLLLRRALDDVGAAAEAPCVSNVGNRSAFVPLLAGCLSRGTPLVLLDEGTPLAYAREVARLAGASIIVSPEAGAGADGAQPAALTDGLWVLRCDADGAPRVASDTAVVKMTSGSTGRAEGVMVTAQALVNDGRHIIAAMGLRPDDVNLAVIPLAHSYGLGNLVAPLLLQGTPMVLRPGLAARQLFADIETYGATVLPGVPFIFDYLARYDAGVPPLSRLRLAVTAGAPIDARVVRAYAERFGRKIHSFYGTSETGGIAFDDSEAFADSPTVGTPLPETTVSLRPSPRGPDEAGRVHVQGNALGSGYLSGAVGGLDGGGFVEDGFLTGDLGRFDPEGRLALTGRVSRFVNIAGRKVSPEEVERVIGGMSGVAEALVLAVPGSPRGDVMVACVRAPDRGVTVDAIRARCHQHLPPYKVPQAFRVLDTFPVDRRGKVDRATLARLAAESIGLRGQALRKDR